MCVCKCVCVSSLLPTQVVGFVRAYLLLGPPDNECLLSGLTALCSMPSFPCVCFVMSKSLL